MDALIDDLLTIARDGETVTDTETIALSGLVARCWGTVDTADAELWVTTDHTVRADGARLRQLFENLLRNAVEHGSTGDRTSSDAAVEHAGEGVTVTVGSLPDGEGFYVEDDGPGIPEGEREQVFENRYSMEGGTGLGLAIVRRIAEAHGWEVDAAKGEDGGARFEVRGVTVLTSPARPR
jgi:signal transduction histidine kinase